VDADEREIVNTKEAIYNQLEAIKKARSEIDMIIYDNSLDNKIIGK
jgi:hypothetical protein